MPYLDRKITRVKWETGNEFAPNEIPADAVTADLRTKSNTLSFWQLETPTNYIEISKIALALVTEADRIDRLDLTWIDKNGFRSQGISVNPSDGRTPVKSLQSTHVDVAKLDLNRLSKIASWIADGLSQNQYRRFTKKEIIQIIIEAIRQDLVSLDDLAPEVKDEIDKEFGM